MVAKSGLVVLFVYVVQCVESQEAKLRAITETGFGYTFRKDNCKDAAILLLDLITPLTCVSTGLKKIKKRLDDGEVVVNDEVVPLYEAAVIGTSLAKLQYAALLVSDRDEYTYKTGIAYYKSLAGKARRAGVKGTKTDWASIVSKELTAVVQQQPHTLAGGGRGRGNNHNYANRGRGNNPGGRGNGGYGHGGRGHNYGGRNGGRGLYNEIPHN